MWVDSLCEFEEHVRNSGSVWEFGEVGVYYSQRQTVEHVMELRKRIDRSNLPERTEIKLQTQTKKVVQRNVMREVQ